MLWQNDRCRGSLLVMSGVKFLYICPLLVEFPATMHKYILRLREA